jgi:hypothetical protein
MEVGGLVEEPPSHRWCGFAPALVVHTCASGTRQYPARTRPGRTAVVRVRGRKLCPVSCATTTKLSGPTAMGRASGRRGWRRRRSHSPGRTGGQVAMPLPMAHREEVVLIPHHRRLPPKPGPTRLELDCRSNVSPLRRTTDRRRRTAQERDGEDDAELSVAVAHRAQQRGARCARHRCRRRSGRTSRLHHHGIRGQHAAVRGAGGHRAAEARCAPGAQARTGGGRPAGATASLARGEPRSPRAVAPGRASRCSSWPPCAPSRAS